MPPPPAGRSMVKRSARTSPIHISAEYANRPLRASMRTLGVRFLAHLEAHSDRPLCGAPDTGDFDLAKCSLKQPGTKVALCGRPPSDARAELFQEANHDPQARCLRRPRHR